MESPRQGKRTTTPWNPPMRHTAPCHRSPARSVLLVKPAKEVVRLEEQLADREVGTRAQLADQVLRVHVQVVRPGVAVREGGHADAEVTEGPDQPHELLGAFALTEPTHGSDAVIGASFGKSRISRLPGSSTSGASGLFR